MMYDKKLKYVLLQDTKVVFSKISGKTKTTFKTAFINAIDNYLIELVSSLSMIFDNKINIQVYSESQVKKTLQLKVIKELRIDPKAVCICLDRFLLDGLETVTDYQQRFFRFHLCRSFDGKKLPRQGKMSFLKQIEIIIQSITDLDNKHLIIIDDGIFSGGTIKKFFKLLSKKNNKASVKKIIVFICNEKSLKNFALFPLEVIKPKKNLYDWINIRDFSPFGGKILATSKNNQIHTSIPYLYPWSDGADANLNMSSQLFTVSEKMIKAFKKLVATYENTSTNKPLTFKELVKNGFPLPNNLEKNIPISVNDSVIEYLDRCIKLIQIEKNRQVVIFDMDGTLYLLDNKHNTYHGSTLENVVLQKAMSFIKVREDCSDSQANAILKIGLTNPVGLSTYLSKRYGISRIKYFNFVWNINPAKIIEKHSHNQTKKTISLLKRKSRLKIVLLTSTPKIWAYKVLKYLEIDKLFESIYTGEQYNQKEEIFTLLAGRYKSENIISIGDQYQTDIEPAQKLGMRTLHVKTPKDLKQLFSIL